MICCESELITSGRIAAEELLAKTFRIDVWKSLDPLNPADFVAIVKSIANAMQGHVDPVEKKAVQEAVDALDIDWGSLPKEARWKLIDHVRHTFFAPLPAQVLPKIDQSLSFYAKDLVTGSKSKSIKKFDLKIEPKLNEFDNRVLTYVTKSQGHFVRDEFGKRSDAFSTKAKSIVESGLQSGLGSGEIAAKLHQDLSGGVGARGYWDMIAMVFANRARTMTQVGAFHEAGITDFLWESLMDEVTSVQCRFLHGRRFPVAGAMTHFDQVEALDDPEDIKATTPFMNYGMVDGKPSLYLGRKGDGPVTHVADVTHNAVGTADAKGSYANGKNDHELLAAGVSAPPIHGRCRSTIIPEMGALEHAPAPPAEPAAVKPPKTEDEKTQAALDALHAIPIDTDIDAIEAKALGLKSTSIFDAETEVKNAFGKNFSEVVDDAFATKGFNEDFKAKLSDVHLSTTILDPLKIEEYLKNPKALASAEFDGVRWKGKTILTKGHEAFAAHKLLGKKVLPNKIALADLDKMLAEHPPAPLPAPAPPRPKQPKAPLLPSSLTDPEGTVVFGKEPRYEGMPLNGVPLTHADAQAWSHIPDAIAEAPLPPGVKMSTGIIVVEPDGRIWIIEPTGHFGGYEHTYPKGKMEAGLTAQQNAHKELWEESGLTASIKGVVGDFKGQTGTTRYYVAHRTGGAPWDAAEESQTVKLASMTAAEKLLNTERDKKVLQALQKKLADDPSLLPKVPQGGHTPKAPAHVTGPHLPAFPPQPQPATSRPSLGADVIMHEKVGAAQGSNDGGFYLGKDGVKRYVKFYSDASQASGEHLANQIYSDLGVGAAKSTVFEHNGKLAYASEILEGKTLGSFELTEKRAKKFMEGFIGDVLTGNWDAVGMHSDNAFVVGDQVLRIDNGGTFLMRAKAGRKESSLLTKITEWDAFFSGDKNPAYSKVAKAAGYTKPEDFHAGVIAQIKRALAVRDAHGGWASYVAKNAPQLAGSDRKAVIDMLEARSRLLDDKRKELEEYAKYLANRPPPPPKGKRFEAPVGRRVQAPPRDEENMAILHYEALPLRDLPTKLNTPPGGESVDVYKVVPPKVAKGLARRAIAQANSQERSAIVDFTGIDYGPIRRAQAAGDTTSTSGRQALNIENSFAKVDKVPGQVFRGIKDLTRQQIDAFMKQDEISLLGIASTSRTASVAMSENFMGGTHGTTPRALLVIHQKTGIPIETISGVSHENEILMSGRANFKILNRHRATENPAIMIFEIEEIDGTLDKPIPGAERRKQA